MKLPEEEQEIAETPPYINELMVAVRQINEAVNKGEGAQLAAEVLITDLPFDWIPELQDSLKVHEEKYNKIIKILDQYCVRGTSPEIKREAIEKKRIATNKYALVVKQTIISLIHKKMGLFKTRRPIEIGYDSTYEEEEEKNNEQIHI